MRAYYGSRISEHMTKTPEGYLICLGVPIARIGSQKYLPRELGIEDGAPDKTYDVMRIEDEVFSPATIASFEGKPVTDDHPMESVDTGNIQAYSCGHAQNVRRGVGSDSDLLIADLFITDKRLIDEIQNGRREVSCGYDCEYDEDENGRILQRAIRGNHVAVVENGRAGHRVAIKDTAEAVKNRREKTNPMNSRNKSLFARLFSRAVRDMEPEEIEDAVEEMAATAAEVGNENEPLDAMPMPAPQQMPMAQDEEGIAEVLAKLEAIEQRLSALEGLKTDAEPDPMQQLEDELTVGNKPVQPEAGVPTQPMDEDPEEAVTISAEEIGDKQCDEDVEIEPKSDRPVNPIAGMDRAAALYALNAMKPVIASLPASQRKAASDKAVREIRKMMGRDSKPSRNGYAMINGVVANAAKSRSKDKNDAKLGQDIMAARNPHYKKA